MNDQWIMFCYGAGAGAGVSFVALAWLFHILGERKRQRRVRATTERPCENAFKPRGGLLEIHVAGPDRTYRRRLVIPSDGPKGPPLRTPPPPPPRTPPSQEDMRQ